MTTKWNRYSEFTGILRPFAFINKSHFILVHDVRIVCGCENPELLPLYCNLQIEICVEK